jgi:membrane protease YdiL (CAAX protease family)
MFLSIKVDLSWKEGDLAILLPVTLLIISFLIYWFTSKSEKVREYFFKKSEADKATVRHITFNRIFGFLMLGIIPGVICLIFLPEYSLADYGLTFKPETTLLSVISILVLALLVVPITWSNAGKPENLAHYPQIRSKIWTSGTIAINTTTWALYLAGYEFLFRGILLFPLAGHLGIWTAVAVNTSLYSATHIPKGFREAIGAIPLGMVFCMLTFVTGTLWIAFFVHLTIALTNSFAALRFHPDMHIKRNIK